MFLILALVACVSGQASWKDCGTAGYHGKISSVTFSPNPPVKGGNTTIIATGVFDEDVTGGTYEIKANEGPLPIFDHKGGVCDSGVVKIDFPLGAGNLWLYPLGCPIKKGATWTQKQVTYASKSAPSGTVVTTQKAVDQNGQPLACVEVTIKL